MSRLAEVTTAAGVRVDVRWHGERQPLPPDIDLSAYRIIQESVTNVVRHAAVSCCEVSISYLGEALAIEITDRGQGGGPAGTGYGLAGMRERVALLHGDFTAGPRPDGGFRVLARVPVPEAGAGPVTVRVVLADDHALVRDALQLIITDTPDLEVVGQAGTGTDAVRLAGDLHPDVVVMDIRMPGMDGIEATRQITAGPGSTRVVVLTTFDDDDYVYGALRAGASGFLVKDMALDDIIAAIRVIAAGDGLISPGVTRRLIAEFAGRPQPAPAPRPLAGITGREREVLARIGRGRSNAEIAAELNITITTVKTYVGGCWRSLAPATGSNW